MREMKAAQVAQLDPFELLPDTLVRIQLWGIGRQTPITIPERHVQLNPDALALDEMPVGLSGWLAQDFDAKVGDVLMAAAEVHLDRRAVNHPEHLRAERIPRTERD
jgi:hypothetical protein